MDNITHSLTGLALARAGLDRLCPRATLLLLISANIPDSDILGLLGGPLKYLEVHRGYTHALLFLPLMALLSVGLVAILYRQKLPWLRAWLVCCLGVASHLLLDWTNSYGIRLLLPFSSAWFHLDIVALWDLVLLAVLSFAALWPLLGGLVSQEIGARDARRGRGVAIFALVFFLVWDLGRAYAHGVAVGQLNTRLYGGEFPVRAAAMPGPINPLHWRAIVETGAAYRVYAFSSFQSFEPEIGTVFFKPAVGAAMAGAMQTEPFRYFAYFARFPLWTASPVSLDEKEVTRVEMTDLRFGDPGQTPFRCVAIEDGQGRVMQSRF